MEIRRMNDYYCLNDYQAHFDSVKVPLNLPHKNRTFHSILNSTVVKERLYRYLSSKFKDVTLKKYLSGSKMNLLKEKGLYFSKFVDGQRCSFCHEDILSLIDSEMGQFIPSEIKPVDHKWKNHFRYGEMYLPLSEKVNHFNKDAHLPLIKDMISVCDNYKEVRDLEKNLMFAIEAGLIVSYRGIQKVIDNLKLNR